MSADNAKVQITSDNDKLELSAPTDDFVATSGTKNSLVAPTTEVKSTGNPATLTITASGTEDIAASGTYTAPNAASLVTRSQAEAIVSAIETPQVVWQPSGVSSAFVFTGDAAALSTYIAGNSSLVSVVIVENVAIDAPINLLSRVSVLVQGSFPTLTFSGTGRWQNPPSSGFEGASVWVASGVEAHAFIEYTAPAAFTSLTIGDVTCTVSDRTAFIEALGASQLMPTFIGGNNLVFNVPVLSTTSGAGPSVIDVRGAYAFQVIDPAAYVGGSSSGTFYWRPDFKYASSPTNPQTNGSTVVDSTLIKVDTLGDTIITPLPANRVHNSVIAWDTTTNKYVDDQDGWIDLLGTFDQRVTGGGALPFTLTQFDVAGRVYEWATTNGAAQQSQGFLTFHWPHDYSPNTDTFIHLHLSVNQSVTTTGVFTIWAGFAKSGDTFPALIQLANISKTFAGAGDVRKHYVVEIPLSTAGGSATTLDTAGYETDGILQVYVNYVRGANGDNMANNTPIFVHFCDVHYLSSGRPTKNRVSPFNT